MHGGLCFRVVCDHLDGASSLSLAYSNCHVLHNIDVGNLAVNINYSFHSLGVCDRFKYWSQSSKYLFSASKL